MQITREDLKVWQPTRLRPDDDHRGVLMASHTRDVSHVEQCVTCYVQVIRDHNPPGMTNGEVAALLPEHLRGPFWDEAIDGYMADESQAVVDAHTATYHPRRPCGENERGECIDRFGGTPRHPEES